MNNADNDPPPIANHNRLAIESLEDYLQRYGLPPSNIQDDDDDGRNGEFNGLNRTEAQERMEAEQAYLDAIIERHHTIDSDNTSNHHSSLRTGLTPRGENGEDCCQENETISILLANQKRHDVPMKPIYRYCETVRRMTVHRSRFGVPADYNYSNDAAANERDNEDDCRSAEGDDDNNGANYLELSLVDFDADATLQFMSALQSLHEHQLQQQHQPPEQTALVANTKEQQQQQQHIIHLIDTQTISSTHIIEVLKLSHFLQCNILLDTLVSIVESSIDLENCLSICSLADALNLTSLFESSVTFVIRRLDALQGSGVDDVTEEDELEASGEEKEVEDEVESSTAAEATEAVTTAVSSADEDSELWKSLPYDLRSRVLTMRNILRSSIIGRGSKMSGIFFSSGNEFLAIFRETISVQKERLAEARERLEEVVRERKEEFTVKRQRRGRWFDSSADAEEKFVYGGDVEYSMRQIERQAKRLATLESFYQEQKIIFSRVGDGDCKKLSFSSK
mmetsp:Transcript_16372/g.26772  ORF Transcript_16372/g.26772 Transcript_16372/m.26772 type:complete len:509 (-) Transcript_16372:26-1552(-)